MQPQCHAVQAIARITPRLADAFMKTLDVPGRRPVDTRDGLVSVTARIWAVTPPSPHGV